MEDYLKRKTGGGRGNEERKYAEGKGEKKEKDAEEANQLVRDIEKLERKEKKKMLEKRWALMSWVAGFIEENTDKWERDKDIRKEERKLNLE